MELAKNEAIQKIEFLLKNIKRLPPDIFDEQNNLRQEITAQIKKMMPLVKKELLSFIKTPMLDMVLFGDLCSPLCHINSDLNIGFVFKANITNQALENTNLSFSKRGFEIKIYRHKIKFFILKQEEKIGANWSLLNKKWNIAPKIQDFEFETNTFFKEYITLNENIHENLDCLERNEKGFYLPKSCEIIKNYFSKLEEKVEKVKAEKADYIYTLDYNLLKALDLFEVREHFKKAVVDSECYYLSGEEDEL